MPRRLFRFEGEKEFLGRAKSEGAHYHQNGFTGNVQGSSSFRKERIVTKNKKIHGRKSLTGKGKYIINTMDQQLKGSKINYNYSKYSGHTENKDIKHVKKNEDEGAKTKCF